MKLDKELLKGTTPLLLLKLLEDESMYGYQIMKRLEQKSNNVFELKEGTIYPILHSLEKEDLIVSNWEMTDSLRKRKYYSITEKGIKELRHREKKWNIFSNAIGDILKEGYSE